MTEKRFWVHDLGEGQASGLTRFSAMNPRYWVVDRTTNLPVEECVTKRSANLAARDLNRKESS